MNTQNFMIKFFKDSFSINQRLAIFVFLSSFYLSSCDDDPNSLGLDMIPPSDKLPAYYIDTVTIPLSPSTYPSYYTVGNNPFLGVAIDPVFGQIWAGVGSDIYFPYPFDTATWGKEKIIDSVKISMYFDSVVYHNPNPADPLDHSFELAIYNLTRPIHKDSLYSKDINPKVFCSGGQLLDLKLLEYPVKNDISFYLPDNALSYFQKYLTMDSSTIISDSLRHQKGVYGLFFSPHYVQGKDIIVRFNTEDTSRSFIRIVYHLENDKSTYYTLNGYFVSYYIDSYQSGYGNAGLSFMTYDYSKAKVKTRLNGATDDSLIYILAEDNIRAKVDFSNLKLLPDLGHYIVLKADLYIPLEKYFYNSSSTYQTKTTMLTSIDLKSCAKSDSFVSYYTNFGMPLYYSKIDTVTNSYMLDVTDYVNALLNNKFSYSSLYFFPYFEYSLQSAFIKNKVRLKIKYLKY
jgi:hypothetical protein